MVRLSEATTSHRRQLNPRILDSYLQLEVALSKGYEPIHYANAASIDSVLKQQSFKQLHDKLCTSCLHGDRVNSFLQLLHQISKFTIISMVALKNSLC